jgi:hypothetical protein
VSKEVGGRWSHPGTRQGKLCKVCSEKRKEKKRKEKKKWTDEPKRE